MESGKDPAFKKLNEGVCSKCSNGVDFKSGVGIRGDKRSPLCYSLPELRTRYEKFEADRIERAKALVGMDKEMKPDEFMVFVLKRTTVCPHKIVDEHSLYWVETIGLLDGEFGLSLPGPIHTIPACFFEALNAVRRARSKAKEQDKDKK